jgi:ornithine carbamoyltransferase
MSGISLKGRDMISLHFYAQEEIMYLLNLARKIKGNPQEYSEALKQKTLAMIFELPSLRTRNSFEVAMTQMGGHANFIKAASKEGVPDPLIGRFIADVWLHEDLEDQAHVLSRYVNAIMIRASKRETILKFAKYADIPVINGMDDCTHPCQALADLLTIQEKKGKLKGLNLTMIGATVSAVSHSTALFCAKMGLNVTLCYPEWYAMEPAGEWWDWVQQDAKESGAKVKMTHDPIEAVRDADVIYVRGWGAASSFDPKSEDFLQRMTLFPKYQLNEPLLKQGKPDGIVMHCLPARRGVEITDQVMDGPHSVVVDEAENRLHAQKAVLLALIKG